MPEFPCPHCAQLLVTDPAHAGQHVVCPVCRELVIAPPADAPSSAARIAVPPAPDGPAPPTDAGPGGLHEPSTAKSAATRSECSESSVVLERLASRRRHHGAQRSRHRRRWSPATWVFVLAVAMGGALALAITAAVVVVRSIAEAGRPDLATAPIEILLEELTDGTALGDRRAAAEAVLARGPAALEAALDHVVDIAADDNTYQYSHDGLDALAEAVSTESVEALSIALDSERADARMAAAQLLGELGEAASPAVESLVRAADDRSRWVRWKSLEALASMGTAAAPATEAVIALLEHPDRFTRRRAAEVLGSIGPRARVAVPALRRTQESDADRSVRRAADAALARIDLDAPAEQALDGLGEVIAALSGEDEFQAAAAAREIGDLGEGAADAVPALARALREHPSPWVREAAAAALGRIGSPAYRVASLLESTATSDDSPEVRAAAAEALSRLEGP